MPDRSSGEEHHGGHAARSVETHGTRSSTEAGLQPGGREAGQKGHAEGEDSGQSSSNEARGASSVRGQHAQPAEPSVPNKARGPVMRSGIRIESVEWHSRIEKDWYAATVFVDLLTFIYVAVFYQVLPLS